MDGYNFAKIFLFNDKIIKDDDNSKIFTDFVHFLDYELYNLGQRIYDIDILRWWINHPITYRKIKSKVDQHKYLIDQKIPMKLFYLTEQYIFIKMSALFDKDKFLKFNKALNKRWNLFS